MFKREFKINLKSLIIWTAILAGIYILIFAVYPHLINDETKASLEQVMSSMPKEILANFNMDIVGIESSYGWFKTEGLVFLNLLGGLYAAILGATILVKEESDKTIEFLYSKPVSRSKIVSSKIFCGVLNILIFTGIITILNYIGLYKVAEFNLNQFLMISLIPLLLYFMMFFISLFLSTFMKKTRKSMSIGIGLVFLSYFMQMIGSMGENIEILKQISPFEFVSSRYIILNGKLDEGYLIIGSVIILLCIAGIYYRYNKKEFLG